MTTTLQDKLQTFCSKEPYSSIVIEEAPDNDEEEEGGEEFTEAEQRLHGLLNCEDEEKKRALQEIRLLAREHPECFQRRYEGLLSADLPLCILLGEFALDVETLSAVHEAFPEALYKRDTDNIRSMLAVAVMCGIQSIDVVHRLIQLDPSALGKKDWHGCLPLHEACGILSIDGDNEQNVSFEERLAIVKLLIHFLPQAMYAFSSASELPLYRACESRGQLEIVEFLVNQGPDAVGLQNSGLYQSTYRNLPIHAAAGGSDLKTLEFLVSRDPSLETLKVGNERGSSPLHCACLFRNLEAVLYLLEQYPDGSSCYEPPNSNLPLHSLLRGGLQGASLDLYMKAVGKLVDAFPAGALDNTDTASPFRLLWLETKDDLVKMCAVPQEARESSEFQILETIITAYWRSTGGLLDRADTDDNLSRIRKVIQLHRKLDSDFVRFALDCFADCRLLPARQEPSLLITAILEELPADLLEKITSPESMELTDPVSNLRPFLLASSLSSLDTAFLLLRNDPTSQLSYYIRPSRG